MLVGLASEFKSPDLTTDIWPWIITSQVVQCITISTSSIPYLRPLLRAYPSGMFKNDDVRRKGTNVSYAIGTKDLENDTVALRAPSNSSQAGKDNVSHTESVVETSEEV